MIEHQKARVHALAHAAERHVYGVGMTTEMAARLQQSHAMLAWRASQPPCCGQT